MFTKLSLKTILFLFKKLITPASFIVQLDNFIKLKSYKFRQKTLFKKFKLNDSDMIHEFDDVTRNSIENKASQHSRPYFIYTSGSTNKPKKILYTDKRLKVFKDISQKTAVTVLKQFRGKYPNVFVMAGLKDDDSFTALVLKNKSEIALPNLLKGLTDPASLMRVKDVKDLVYKYGINPVRMWLILLSSPSIVYSTNPSTLAVFLSSISENWDSAKLILKDFLQNEECFQTDNIKSLLRRHSHINYYQAIQKIANLDAPDWDLIFPELKVICCWDGGYVTPFIDQVRKYLPESRYALFPMYSMSTEVIETVPILKGKDTFYLPMTKGVCYEFLPEHAPNNVSELLKPWQLVEGKLYSMVVTDEYGLRRYQTNDLFICFRKIDGICDLRFVRRKGIQYSFTGEKITGEQLTMTYSKYKQELQEKMNQTAHMTFIPSLNVGNKPGYYFVLAPAKKELLKDLDLDEVQRRIVAILGSINDEFKSKIESQRLVVMPKVVEYSKLASIMDAKTTSSDDIALGAWESQFKLLPLYKKHWEEYGLD